MREIKQSIKKKKRKKKEEICCVHSSSPFSLPPPPNKREKKSLLSWWSKMAILIFFWLFERTPSPLRGYVQMYANLVLECNSHKILLIFWRRVISLSSGHRELWQVCSGVSSLNERERRKAASHRAEKQRRVLSVFPCGEARCRVSSFSQCRDSTVSPFVCRDKCALLWHCRKLTW